MASVLPEIIGNQIEKIVTSEGYELVHIDYRQAGRTMVLRIDIDREGGINLEDCTLISQQVSTYMDVEDAIQSEYELQVSSPGLDRPIYKEADYHKFIGRLIRVKTSQMIRGLFVIVGHLRAFDGSQIVVEDPKSKKGPYEIELSLIKEARLEVEM